MKDARAERTDVAGWVAGKDTDVHIICETFVFAELAGTLQSDQPPQSRLVLMHAH